jgi:hypothetical protein
MEPVTTYVRWLPSRECGQGDRRGIEGIYLLKKMPHISNNIRTIIPPMEFEDGAFEAIKQCMKEVRKRFHTFDPVNAWIKKDWEEWENNFAPTSDSSIEYIHTQTRIRKHSIYVPLRSIAYDKDTFMIPTWSNKIGDSSGIIDSNFQFPEMFAITMNSVQTEFNTQPQPPRLYSINSQHLMEDVLPYFKGKTLTYYDNLKSNVTVIPSIKKILKRKVLLDGIAPSLAGNLNYSYMVFCIINQMLL